MTIKRALIVLVLVLIVLGLIPVIAFYALQAEPPTGPVTPTDESPRDTNWQAAEVLRGLEHPWAAAWLPNDEGVLITERPGRIRLYVPSTSASTLLADLSSVAYVSGQAGLMDIALHPQFGTNRFVYYAMSTGTDDANRTTLFRAKLTEDRLRLENHEELFRVAQNKSGNQHFGSVIEWLPDGSLLLSIGDGGNPPVSLDGQLIRNQAQNRETAFGSVLRMLDDGTPHPDNPFAGEPGEAPFVYTYGNRNVQGLARRPGTTEVWATEHGSKGGDEFNKLEPGTNYGWPEVTYAVEYWGFAIAESASMPGAKDPLVVWTPAIAPSGLAFYDGNAFPEWRGDLLAGGLVAQQLRRIDFNESGDIDGQTTLQFDERIRWVGTSNAGELFVLTDSPTGALLRIDPK